MFSEQTSEHHETARRGVEALLMEEQIDAQ
jgi:hypothetical protein